MIETRESYQISLMEKIIQHLMKIYGLPLYYLMSKKLKKDERILSLWSTKKQIRYLALIFTITPKLQIEGYEKYKFIWITTFFTEY